MLKKAKIFVLTLTIITILFVGMSANASTIHTGTCGDNLTWTLDDEGTLTINGSGTMNSSDEYDLFTEYKEEITSIVFTSGITEISGLYFSLLTNLKNLYIPNTYSIGNDFYKIENVVGNCKTLENIFVDSNNEEFSDIDGVLYNKEKTKIIRMPRGRSGIVEIPEGVERIAEKTFYNCQYITKIIFPSSIYSFDSFLDVFYNCYLLEDICMSEENIRYKDIDGVLYDKNINTIYKYPTGKNAELYEIPDSVTSIWTGAFRFDKNLKTIAFRNITQIYSYAFAGCESLTTIHYYGDQWGSINIMEYNASFTDATVEYKGNPHKTYSFITNGGTAVENIFASYIKSSPYTNLDGMYFMGWYDNSSFDGQMISFPYYGDATILYAKWSDELVGTCGNELDWKLDSYGTFRVSGTGPMTDYSNDSENLNLPPWYRYIKNIKSVVVEDGVTHIGNEAFYYSYGGQTITSITLPTSLKSIGDKAFCFALNIESIDFPEGLVSIGDEAFRLCHLKEVSFPDTMERIGEYAFYVNNFRNIDLGNGIKTIEPYAFSSSYTSSGEEVCKLESITLPNSLEKLEAAFCWCYDLKEINIDEQNENFKLVDRILYSKDGKQLILCPVGIKKTGSVKIIDGTEVVCERAFDNCEGITEIIIPEGVTTLKDGFASGCNLEKIYIPSTVTTLSFSAFFSSLWYNNWEIPHLYYNGTQEEWEDLTAEHSYQAFYGDSTEFHWNYQYYQCGDNLTWTLDDKGTLTISGTGRMYDYNYSSWETDAPWFVHKTKIKAVNVTEGVTGIGKNAFFMCDEVMDITLPKGIEYIGEYAFDSTAFFDEEDNWDDGILYIDNYLISYNGENNSCVIKDGTVCLAEMSLYKQVYDYVVIPASAKYIGNSCFYGCEISTVYYAGTKEEWNNISIGLENDALDEANIKFKTVTEDDNIIVKNLRITPNYIVFDIELTENSSDSIVYIAIYDNMGRLLCIESYSKTDCENIVLNKEGEFFKVMWWENKTIKPLSKNIKLNFEN